MDGRLASRPVPAADAGSFQHSVYRERTQIGDLRLARGSVCYVGHGVRRTLGAATKAHEVSGKVS